MGFKCPECNKDFGIDRKSFNEHIKKCGDGCAKEIVDAYISIDKQEAEQHLTNYRKIKMQKILKKNIGEE